MVCEKRYVKMCTEVYDILQRNLINVMSGKCTTCDVAKLIVEQSIVPRLDSANEKYQELNNDILMLKVENNQLKKDKGYWKDKFQNPMIQGQSKIDSGNLNVKKESTTRPG